MRRGPLQPPWVSPDRRRFSHHQLLQSTLEYTDTNEDTRATLACLRIQPGKILVGVTGTADLLLLALAVNPAFVAGYDTNPAQNALAELKRAAIGRLSYAEYLALFGYRGAGNRQTLLRSVVSTLHDDVRAFWLQDEMRHAVQEGLWRQGSATRSDLASWEAALRQLEARVGPHEMRIVLGIEGSREKRKALRKRIARVDPKYAEPAISNNNHFKFDAFRYPDGMAHQPCVARYAAHFLPPEFVPPPFSEDEYLRIRERVHRISFQTVSFQEGLDAMPRLAFDRAYLSNITEYMTTGQERQLVESLLEKGNDGSVTVLLYLALSPGERRDLLDHSAWSERGVSRLIHAQRLQRALGERVRWGHQIDKWSRAFGLAFEGLSMDDGQQAVRGVRDRLRFDVRAFSRQSADRIQRTIRQVGRFNYPRAGSGVLDAARSAWRQSAGRWEEMRQLSTDDQVLLENEERSAALFSDLYANLRATHSSKSFYGFDYAILEKVVRHGATYALPKQDDGL